VVTSVAAPKAIEITLDMPGEIVPNADGLAHIVPRFPGIARQVHKGLGDPVNKGEVVAVIESNESLSPYEVTSLLSGTVIEKHITLGEFVRDDADIYVIADLSTVWVNITVYARDLERVRRGQRVRIAAVAGESEASGVIDYVGHVLGEATRSAVARVVLPNRQRHWRPGMFVTARIALEQVSAPLAVEDAAVQRLEGRDVVFVQEDDAYESRPVTLGRSDGQWVEILSGLEPGERYVAQGSFILKSELLKSEAGHEH
jgi:cobalt-zinc-cadmium efflux system membrane fusion protein